MGAASTAAAYANDLQSLESICYSEPFSVGGSALYVCNCNGLRKRDVAAAIEAGATRPREVFARNHCTAQCAKCVCEMRQMIDETRDAYAMAAE